MKTPAASVSNVTGFFKGKKVLVTGHTGFKGSWLVQMLAGMGSDVAGYALAPNTKPNLFYTLGLDKKTRDYTADIRNYKKVLGTVKAEKPEIVIHMAAQPLVRDSYDDPVYTYETNVIGTANVLQAIKESSCVRSAVMITTDKVYENKETGKAYVEEDRLGGYDPYSASKACAELIASSYQKSFFGTDKYGDEHHTLVATARAGNVIGGGDWSKDRLIPDIVRAILEKNQEVIIRNPQATRPWQHVLDPLWGYLLLAKGLYEGKTELAEAWNFAPAENGIIVEEIVKKAVQKLRKGKYTVKKDSIKHEMSTLTLNADKARKKLSWSPVFSIDQGLEWTFEWYEKFYGGKTDMAKFTNAQIAEFFSRCGRR